MRPVFVGPQFQNSVPDIDYRRRDQKCQPKDPKKLFRNKRVHNVLIVSVLKLLINLRKTLRQCPENFDRSIKTPSPDPIAFMPEWTFSIYGFERGGTDIAQGEY